MIILVNILSSIEHIAEGNIYPRLEAGQIVWSKPVFSYPHTPHFENKNIDPEYLFNPGDPIPETGTTPVNMEVEPSIKAALLAIDPSTEQPYAHSLGITIEESTTDAEILSQLDGIYLEFQNTSA